MLLARSLVAALNRGGAVLVTLTALIVSVYLVSTFTLAKLQDWFGGPLAFAGAVVERCKNWFIERSRRRMEKRREKARQQAEERAAARAARRQEALVSEREAQILDPDERPPSQPTLDFPAEDIPICPLEGAPAPVARKSAPRTATEPRHASTTFRLPTTDLLNEPQGRAAYDEQELKDIAARVKSKFEEFNVLGLGRADQPRPGGHDIRIQARSGYQVQPHHHAERGSLPGPAGRIHSDRAHSREADRRHRSPQYTARGDQPARGVRIGRVRSFAIPSDDLAGQGHQRPHQSGGARFHAAPADRRLHRIRQERHDQLADHVDTLQIDARRRAHDPGGSQAARTGPLRRHSAPADARDHRPAQGHQRAAQRRARNGTPPAHPCRAGRAQHRPVQQEDPQTSAGTAQSL